MHKLPPEGPPSEVRLCEIDVDDRVFQVRGFGRPARFSRDDLPGASACHATPALLWLRSTPFKVVRGFAGLDSLRRAVPGADCRVPARFMEDVDPRPTFARAMLIACGGAEGFPELSTLECSLALRRLRSHGSTDAEVREFLRGARVPKRTAARARLLARWLPDACWEALKDGEMGLCHAETVVQWVMKSGTLDLGNDMTTILAVLVQSTNQKPSTRADHATLLERRPKGAQRPEKRGKPVERERPLWELTRKKRLVVRRANLSIYGQPVELLRTAKSYRELAAFLEDVAKRGGERNPCLSTLPSS
jgi:hypothetical protein